MVDAARSARDRSPSPYATRCAAMLAIADLCYPRCTTKLNCVAKGAMVLCENTIPHSKVKWFRLRIRNSGALGFSRHHAT